MQILALELENAKSYEYARIEFTPGMNAIVGHNGAGKSTIVEAIGFTLFDSLPYRHRDFVREGAKSATVTTSLLSSFDERAYDVVRRCGSANQYYVFDPDIGGKLAEGKADVLSFLRQHMEVRPGADLEKLFSDAVGVPQGTFTAAFHLTPALRKGIFDPLLHVEEYRTAYDRLREPVGVVRERRQALDVRIAGFGGQLERLPQLQRAIAQRSEEISAGQSALVEAETQLKQIGDRRTQLEGARTVVTDLEKQAAAQNARLEGLRKQLATARNAVQDAEAAHAVVIANQAGYELYISARKQLGLLEVRVDERRTLLEKRNRLNSAQALIAAEIDGATAALKEVSDAESTIERLQPIVARQSELEKAWQSAKEAQTRSQALEGQLKKRRFELQQMESRLETFRSQREMADNLEKELLSTEESLTSSQLQGEHLRLERSRHEAEVAGVARQQKALQAVDAATCPLCEQPLTAQHRDELLDRNGQRTRELELHISTLRQQEDGSNAQVKELRSAVQKLNGKLRSLPRPADLAQLEQTIEERRQEVANSSKEMESWSQAATQVASLRTQLDDLGRPGDELAIARDMAARRPGLEGKIVELRARMAATEAELADQTPAFDAFDGLDEAISALRAEIEDSAGAHQAVLANEKLAASRDAYAAESMQLATQVEQTGAELATLQEQLVHARRDFDESVYNSVLQAEQDLRAEHSGLKTRSGMLSQLQTRDRSDLAELEQVAVIVAQLETERSGLEHQGKLLEDMRTLLRRAGPYITKALIGQVSEDAATIFGDVMQDYSRHLIWHEDYGITLDVEGRERQFSQLSGGEQMSAALAVRLALLREMSGIDVAFFDEPTTNLDEMRRESLARQILQVKGLSQLFVISHDDTFEQATETLIRVERVDGVSRIEVG